ncbi:MAG: cytochrome c biogenesis protein CcsA [Verrucomicrobiota bacterium]
MDRWILIAATVLAACGSVRGMLAVHRGRRSRSTVFWMGAALVCQMVFLWSRGQHRGVCPLKDLGEMLVFLSWSLTVFYLLIGPAYRISLLGVFSAPVVVVFQAVALLPGVLQGDPQKVSGGNPWHEMHSATSVLAYGALALAAVAGVMFLVLDRQLKEHHLQSGLFRGLPPVRELLVSLQRLLWLGTGLLTMGVVAGFLMPHDKEAVGHLVTALAVWSGYAALLGVQTVRGLTGRRLALLAVTWFILSLGVFAFI